MSDARWRAVVALAGRQRGYIDRAQLRRLGVSNSTIDSWIRTGRLILGEPAGLVHAMV